MNVQKKNRNIGAALLFFIFGLLFFVLAVRFVTIQYTGEAEGRALAARAAQMYLRTDVLQAKRGTIFDRNGQVIAEDSSSYTLVAVLDENLTVDPKHPNHVIDPEKTAAELAEHIPLSEQEIYERLTKEGKKQVEFGNAGRDLPHQVKKKIEHLNLPGITFMKDTKRYYPNGIFASHLIGYAQKEEKSTEIVGKTGLENSFNDLLKGKDGSMKYEGDVWNYILPNSKKQIIEPQNGHDLYLTIDKKIQTFLEDAMNKVEKEFRPNRIMAIVSEPQTGKILAMGQRPTYHPATREGIEKTWHNEVVETSFEPGSTMKIFSLAAAMEEKKFNPNETFESGRYYVDKIPINDHNRGAGWGTISYLEGVQRSSNVAFARLLEKMGTETWRQYLDDFKFGTKTGIALPNEAGGQILYDWPVEKVTSVYGQGTTVTALQMVQAMSAVANDGKMMKPYVVDKIVNENDGTITESKPEMAGQPISEKTAKELRNILETVVTSPVGTGHMYELEGYSVAGKTGTSQIPNPQGGGYLTGRNNYIFSFLGTAPADDPRLVVYVLVERPQLKATENGALPVSMIFNPVMKNSLQYLNIEPEEKSETNITHTPDVINMSVKEAEKTLVNEGLQPVFIGKGKKVAEQIPASGSSLIKGEKVIIKTEGKLTVPDMTGWSMRDVLKVAQAGELRINMVGSGFAAKQNLKPNSAVKAGAQLVVNFETPLETIDRIKNQPDSEEDEAPLD